jgi:class 3 adenylate cyclase
MGAASLMRRGDIIVAEDKDIHGDGVNVTARLEGGFTREEAGEVPVAITCASFALRRADAFGLKPICEPRKGPCE